MSFFLYLIKTIFCCGSSSKSSASSIKHRFKPHVSSKTSSIKPSKPPQEIKPSELIPSFSVSKQIQQPAPNPIPKPLSHFPQSFHASIPQFKNEQPKKEVDPKTTELGFSDNDRRGYEIVAGLVESDEYKGEGNTILHLLTHFYLNSDQCKKFIDYAIHCGADINAQRTWGSFKLRVYRT